MQQIAKADAQTETILNRIAPNRAVFLMNGQPCDRVDLVSSVITTQIMVQNIKIFVIFFHGKTPLQRVSKGIERRPL